MRVLQIYNQYRNRGGGEPTVVANTIRLLREHGQDVDLLERDSLEIRTARQKIRAAIQGVYSFSARRLVRDRIRNWRPDVVHVHNLYPRFSPSILVECRRAGVPVVMTVHNYNLTCPTWWHLYKGSHCDDCVGGHEYRCLLKNCRNNIFESGAYALRSAVARRFRLFHDNVSVLIALTPFAKARLLQAGFREDQIAVVPNPTSVTDVAIDKSPGKYVAYAGRVSPEKGVDIFLHAAKQMPDVPFKVAGDGDSLSEMKVRAPRNVEFLGKLGSGELSEFYKDARMLVVPSVCFEQFGLVAVEAMSLGVPVVASRIGGLPYVVEDGVSGSLFEPGNAADLARKVRQLWEDPQSCERFGAAGRQKVMREFTEDRYFLNLISVYTIAIQQSKYGMRVSPLVQINNAVLR